MEKALFFFEKTIADTSNGVILEQSWVQITVMVKNPLKIQGSYRAKNQSKEKTTRPKSKTVLHVIINSHLFIHKFERLFWLLICSIFLKKTYIKEHVSVRLPLYLYVQKLCWAINVMICIETL